MSLQKSNDIIAYGKILYKFNNNYDELVDSLYQYMKSYLEDKRDIELYRDEIENLLGIRNHGDIINYIINDNGGE